MDLKIHITGQNEDGKWIVEKSWDDKTSKFHLKENALTTIAIYQEHLHLIDPSLPGILGIDRDITKTLSKIATWNFVMVEMRKRGMKV